MSPPPSTPCFSLPRYWNASYIFAAWVFGARGPGSGTSFALSLIRTNRRRVTRIFYRRNKEKEEAVRARDKRGADAAIFASPRSLSRVTSPRFTSTSCHACHIGEKYRRYALISISKGSTNVFKPIIYYRETIYVLFSAHFLRIADFIVNWRIYF